MMWIRIRRTLVKFHRLHATIIKDDPYNDYTWVAEYLLGLYVLSPFVVRFIFAMPSIHTSDITRASDSTYFVDLARLNKLIITYLLT